RKPERLRHRPEPDGVVVRRQLIEDRTCSENLRLTVLLRLIDACYARVDGLREFLDVLMGEDLVAPVGEGEPVVDRGIRHHAGAPFRGSATKSLYVRADQAA